MVYADGIDGNLGTPLGDARVYFIAPDGTSQLLITGVDGLATAISPAGTVVMIEHRDADLERFLYAYEEVMPNDTITNGAPATSSDDTCLPGASTVTFPAYAGATTYVVDASCSSGTRGPETTLPILCVIDDCPQLHAASLLVSAKDANGDAIGYASVTDIDLAQHLDASHPIAFPALQPAAPLTATITGLPATMGMELTAWYLRANDPTHFSAIDVPGDISGTTATASAPVASFGDLTHAGAHFELATFAALDYTVTFGQRESAIAIDASTSVHPAHGTSYDNTAHTVTWLEGSEGTSTDAVASIALRWTTTTGIDTTMLVLAPHGPLPTVVVPVLPPDLAAVLAPTVVQVGVTLRNYVGKTYRDVLVGNAGDAAIWETSF